MRGAPRPRRLGRRRPGAGGRARRRGQDRRANGARVPPRRLQRLAPALGRGSGARRAGGRPGASRARVPEHRPSDGDALSRRRGRLPAAKRGGERRGARPSRGGRRRGLGPNARGVLPERRPRLRRVRDRALVDRRARPRREGVPAARAARNRRARRRAARLEPRLADRDVSVGAGPRSACALGAAHRPRPGRRRLRLHDPGDRRRSSGGRDAGSARRWRAPRRRPRRADPGARRPRGDEPRRRRGAGGKRLGSRRPPCRRRDNSRRPCGDRQRHADAALRAPAARRRGARSDRRAGKAVPLRARRHADPLRPLRTAALGGGRAAGPNRDRPPDARARRRLPGGERGGQRVVADRGNSRRRPTA